MKFAECMRENGVPDFPDPNASDDFVYGVSVSPAVWQKAPGLGLGLVASMVAVAAWARTQIVRWEELIRPPFPTPPGQGTPLHRLDG